MPVHSYEDSFGVKVMEALGLGGHPIRRIVIDIDTDSAVMVYIQRHLCETEVPAIIGAIKVQACKTLDVDEVTHEVVWTPEGERC